MLGIVLLAQAMIALAGPLGSSPAGVPGSSPNTIPAGSSLNSTQTNANDSGQSQFRPSIRGVETMLAVLSAVLLSVTYATLIGPGTRLSSTSKLPLASIEENIGTLLSKTWPDTSTSANLTAADGENAGLVGPANSDAIRLLYLGKMGDGQRKVARGIEQCEALPDKNIDTPPMWLTVGSSLTRSMVQLAVWEWVSLWMAVAMVACTLAFNGFFSNNRGTDSYPRLVVVLVYAVAFCFHAWYVWSTCKSFFTLLGAGATWSMLNKAGFASVDLGQLQTHLEEGPEPVFRQVGKPASSAVFPAYDAYLAHEHDLQKDAHIEQNPVVAKSKSSDTRRGAEDSVNDWQKAEISSTVEAGRLALDRTVTNIMTMVGIIVTSGFAAWTSKPSSQSSQLGSLALLASLGLGTGAMFSSVVELSVMDTSFRNVLFLKEIMINGKAADHVEKRASRTRVIGFTHKTVEPRKVRTRDLAKMCSPLALLLFGPAYVLLPSKADHSRQSDGASFELNVLVRGKPVIFTTETTNKHSKDADERNVEAINVCYVPIPEPSNEVQLVKQAVQVTSSDRS